MSPLPRILGPVFLCAVGPAAGCGYSAGFGLEREGVGSVGVEIVTNDSFRQRLEYPLTREIQRELEARVGTRTASPARADAILRVRIRSAREQALAEGLHGVVVAGSLVLAIDAELVLRRTGQVLRRGRIADRGEFILPAGEGYQDALEKATAKIARRVVLLMDPEIATLMAWRGADPSSGRSASSEESREAGEGEETRHGSETGRSLDQ